MSVQMDLLEPPVNTRRKEVEALLNDGGRLRDFVTGMEQAKADHRSILVSASEVHGSLVVRVYSMMVPTFTHKQVGRPKDEPHVHWHNLVHDEKGVLKLGSIDFPIYLESMILTQHMTCHITNCLDVAE